jgi:hypothetical protein
MALFIAMVAGFFYLAMSFDISEYRSTDLPQGVFPCELL